MFPSKSTRRLLKKVFLHSIKLPVIFLIIGLTLIALSYADDFFVTLTHFQNFFTITDKIGNIFIVLTLITFIYKMAISICRRVEKKLFEQHKIASLMISSLRKGLR